MAARKKEPKPILATKHDFVDSLEALMQQSLMMIQMCESVIQHKVISNKGIEAMLVERLAAFKKAIFVEDGEPRESP